MTFGTLLSSQGTDASFGPVSPGPSGRFPSFTSLSCCLAFPTLSDAFQCPIPVEAGCFRGSSLSRFPFPAVPTLPDSLSFRFRSEFDFRWPMEGLAFRRVRYVSPFPWQLIIESVERIDGHTRGHTDGMRNMHPPGWSS
ncbi:hypothetical protein DKT74_14360 [Streptomyces sp. ZEA17I]|nr:hypothetical protein DKT74_14360 [Streptomyces sp. ZEA17I]